MKKIIYKAISPPFIDPKDKRFNKIKSKVDKNGIYDSELWNLDTCFAHFILPRLKRYNKIRNGFPVIPECYKSDDINFSDKESTEKNDKEWSNIIKKMIKAFKLIIEDKYNRKNDKEIKEGLELFAKYFRALWD